MRQNDSTPRCEMPEWNAWRAMRARCHNPRHPNFHHYGGRGIEVCERWESFEAFYADMGPRPSAKHSIDRIDNNAGYNPENCRWAVITVQQRNRRSTHYLSAFGKTQCIAAWAEEKGLPSYLLCRRINSGWDPEEALTLPPGAKRPVGLRRHCPRVPENVREQVRARYAEGGISLRELGQLFGISKGAAHNFVKG